MRRRDFFRVLAGGVVCLVTGKRSPVPVTSVIPTRRISVLMAQGGTDPPWFMNDPTAAYRRALARGLTEKMDREMMERLP